MQDLSLRRILVFLILLIAGLAAMILAGSQGIGTKIGAPGVDKLVSGLADRLRLNVASGPMPETTLPPDIREIAGTWSGVSDVDGTVWRFTFEENFAVRASSSSGYSCDGTAFLHWKLGLTEGHVRVPPGWSMLDVDTIDSSEPSHRNKVSLGAYSLQGNTLKYCFGEPGKLVRPAREMSVEGIKCFELTKVAAGEGGQAGVVGTLSVQNKVPAPAEGRTIQRDPSISPSSKSIRGSAEMIVDGSREIWQLRTDNDSSTDLSDPHRVTLQFQAHGAMFPLARRIELTIDATRTGKHHADGAVYLDNLFIRERVPVGSDSNGLPQAVLLYIAEGGRIFSPQTSCETRVTRTYGGGADISLEGRLESCTVSSAGEHHTVEAVSFSVTGRVR